MRTTVTNARPTKPAVIPVRAIPNPRWRTPSGAGFARARQAEIRTGERWTDLRPRACASMPDRPHRDLGGTACDALVGVDTGVHTGRGDHLTVENDGHPPVRRDPSTRPPRRSVAANLSAPSLSRTRATPPRARWGRSAVPSPRRRFPAARQVPRGTRPRWPRRRRIRGARQPCRGRRRWRGR